jgi:hypothetical protein
MRINNNDEYQNLNKSYIYIYIYNFSLRVTKL